MASIPYKPFKLGDLLDPEKDAETPIRTYLTSLESAFATLACTSIDKSNVAKMIANPHNSQAGDSTFELRLPIDLFVLLMYYSFSYY
jgi:hypothetical protein